MNLIYLTIFVILNFTAVKGTENFYFITVPNLLMIETTHKFAIHTSTDLILTIEASYSGIPLKDLSPVYVIKKGISSIPFTIPFVVDNNHLKIIIRFRGDICSLTSCQSSIEVFGNFVNETHEIEIIDKNFIIFAETNKPLYKPGDKIKLRFMPIYPTNLKWDPIQIRDQKKVITTNNNNYELVKRNRRNTFDMIIIENSFGLRLAQWRNVSIENAMNLEYQLNKDPVFGLWNSKAVYGGQEEVITFKVVKYVLPRFVVNIYPPNQILGKDTIIIYKVCAKYSTGKKMKAQIESRFCMIFNDVEKKCQTVKYTLQKNICAKFKILTKILYNLTNQYQYARTKSEIYALVIENGTSSKVEKIVESSGINYTPYTIKFESKPYFKPGLPYFGRIQLLRHDNKPKRNEIITISVYHWGSINNWGFEKNEVSDKNGVIEFIIPYIPLNTSFTIELKGNPNKIERPMILSILYQEIRNWESVDKQYLQVLPIKEIIKCPGILNLNVVTSYDISTIDMYVQMFSRGQISETIEYPAVPVKCFPRNDFIGHFNCINGIDLVCLPGWKGGNCREPICTDGCLNGACIEPNKCICKLGWKGKQCDKCVTPSYCKFGHCFNGYDCKCLPGWRGYDCSYKGPIIHHGTLTRIDSKPRVIVKQNNNNTIEKQTIFERTLTVPLLKDMGPDLHIVIYFISSNKEIIVDTIEISKGLENCSHIGGGKFQFDRTVSLPKSKVKLLIDSGMQNTSCAVRITDLSLSQFGQSSNVDLSYLIEKLIKLNHRFTRDRFKNSQIGTSCIPDSGWKRMIYSDNSGYDSKTALDKAGLTSITNARIINKKCSNIQIMFSSVPTWSFQMLESTRETEFDSIEPTFKRKKFKPEKNILKSKITSQVREYFPESWLFSYFNKTVKVLNLTVPDSMTTWKAESFCMTEKGIWIAPAQKLKVIKSYFIDIYVPYSIKLSEKLKLPVKLFNYADSCYEIYVQINVKATEIYIIGLKSFTLCVCANDEKTVYFNIEPKIIGKLNITVDSFSKYSTFCSKNQLETNIEMSDSVRRPLIVEPSGVPTETTFSELICNRNEQLGVVSVFTIPTTIVPGSLRSYVTFNGDVMGQTFDNLDKLVKMPYGCGEQNMVAVVPSIYVLEYLTKLQINNPVLIVKAKQYITHGYVRQMTYKHNDGSFSAFGKIDKFGSTWLTAFVLKSFQDASKYVNINNKMLMDAVRYLESMQQSSGCFREQGKLLSSTMAGGVRRNDNTDDSLLTAYVIISLKKIKLAKTAFNISKAMECIQSGLNSDKSNFRLALTGYAFSLYQKSSKFTIYVIEELIKRSISVGRYRYWPFDSETTIEQKSKSVDIETTGYALLALQEYQSLSDSLKTVYWLSNQRNSLGGYYSTQDTVVALSALAAFAETVGLSNNVNLNLSITLNNNKNYYDLITTDNRLVSRIFNLGAEDISYVSIKTNGTGCVSVQLISLYNIEKFYSAKETFKLSVKTEIISVKQCNIRKIKICFSYLRRDKDSNMILLIINYPSGWELTEEELINLSSQISTPLNRIDFQKNKMELYYDAFSYNDAGKDSCFRFQLEEKSKISNLQPALIKLLDYYNPEIYTETSYSMFNKDCNSSDNKIPEIPKVLLCPVCVNDSLESTINFIQSLCQSWFQGFVVDGQNGMKNRIVFEAKQSFFYEWKLDLEPMKCSCLKTWKNLNNSFIILSSRWKYLSDKLILSNDSVMYPINTLYSSFKYDLQNQCQMANNLYMMMNRLLQDFSNKTGRNNSCPSCILGSNYYFKIQNLTAWYCANYTDWNLTISDLSPIIKGILKNNISSINVEIEFPNHLCYCCEQIRDLKKSFRIVDLKHQIPIIDNKSIKPFKLLLNNDYEVIEENVFLWNKHIKCGKQ